MTLPVPIPGSLDEVPASVETALREFFGHAVPAAEAISPRVGAAARQLAEFVLQGGKRVRPTFAFAGWLAGSSAADSVPMGPNPSDAADALRIGAALELVQACALVHDDIIDRSDTRRGHPTLHRIFEAGHRSDGWSGDAAEYGVSAAILIGDLALAWADDLAYGHLPGDASPPWGDPRPLPPAVGRAWSSMRTEVLCGQYLDIANEAGGDESIGAAYRVMEFKTAAYTVARPLELGATLAGASPRLVGDLRTIGHDLGVAFQLRDDLLGVFGDPERTGKPSGDDLMAGKRTALLAVGLARTDEHDPASAARLRDYLGRPLDDDEVRSARTILVEAGAVDEVERQISGLLDSAITVIDRADLAPEIRAELTEFGRRIAHRVT